jgi:hypothetical protein
MKARKLGVLGFPGTTSAHVGTAVPGCAVEQSSTLFMYWPLHCGASLRRTAEGGCPHVDCGCPKDRNNGDPT